MNAQANALVTSAQSITGLNRDAKLRIFAYLVLRDAGSSATNIPSLKAAAAAFQGWNDELQLNALIVAFAKLSGLSTDGPTLQTLVDSTWGIAGGIVDAEEVRNLTWYATLLLSGASLSVP